MAQMADRPPKCGWPISMVNKPKISDLNTSTLEGALLTIALNLMALSPEIRLNGKTVDGRTMTPDEILAGLIDTARAAHENRFGNN